jgi:ubiquinone/menaquinone biosynthesis C-methylase UbiE
MGLKELFEDWTEYAGTRYKDKQWLLSKWEPCEGIEWPRDKVEAMVSTIVDGLDLKGSDTLADLGCGGGWIMKLLEPHSRWVMGLDFCWDMLKNARLIHPQGCLVQGAIGRLPVKDNTFDKALSYFVFLNFVEDAFIEAALLDVRRILKKGGCALIGQIPDGERSKDYDAAKAQYLDYCRRVFTLGASNRDIQRVPQKLFNVSKLRSFLEREKIRYEIRPTFNPFYHPGAPKTVDWRFDLVLFKD